MRVRNGPALGHEQYEPNRTKQFEFQQFCEPNRARNPALWTASAESGCGEDSAASVLASSNAAPMRSAKPGVEPSPRRSAQSLGGLARHRPRPGEASRTGHLDGNPRRAQAGGRAPVRSRPLAGSAGRGGLAWHSARCRQAPPETGGRFGFTWGRRRVAKLQSNQETPLRYESKCKPTRPRWVGEQLGLPREMPAGVAAPRRRRTVDCLRPNRMPPSPGSPGQWRQLHPFPPSPRSMTARSRALTLGRGGRRCHRLDGLSG